METAVISTPTEIAVISTNDLRVPSWNPRHRMDEQALQNLTEFIRQGGLVPRIQAWKGEGKAPFDVISGQRRLEAFRRAGIEKVEVEILDIPLDQAKILATTSNEGEPLDWLDDYENLETLLADHPGWGGITALASKLGREMTGVNRAINLMKLLTPAARQMVRDHRGNGEPILGSAKNSGSDNTLGQDQWELTERVATRLTGLLKGRTLEEAQALAEKAIPLILSKQMTASQVDQWVKQANGTGGQAAEALPAAAARPTPRPKGGVADTPDSATSLWSRIAGLFPQPKAAKTMVLGGVLGAVGGFLASNFKRVLSNVTRRYMLHALVALGLVGYIGSHWVGSKAPSGVEPPAKAVPPVLPEEGDKKPAVASKPKAPAHSKRVPTPNSSHLTHLPTGPQAGRQDLVGPSQSADNKGGTKGGLAPNSTKLVPAWAQDDLPAAKDFANRFYGVSFANWNDTLSYLKERMVGNGIQAMEDQYFPASLYKEMQIKMLVQYFSSQGAKVIGGEGDTAEILVQGTMTTTTRAGRNSQTLSTKPVALLLAFRLVEGFGSKIEKVTEVDPGTVSKIESASVATPSSASGQAGSPGVGLGDVLKDVSNAATTVNNTVSAVDQAKKVLGF